jgi:ArsR family transcriptional regulator
MLNAVVSIAKALGDSGRARILMSLSARELCVCQIIELLGLAPSTVSKHLAVLAQAGLVEGRKDGRFMHYHLASEKEAALAVRETLSWARKMLSRDPRVAEDAKRLRAILKISPEELCRRQMEKSKTLCCPAGQKRSSRTKKRGVS